MFQKVSIENALLMTKYFILYKQNINLVDLYYEASIHERILIISDKTKNLRKRS